MLVNDDPFLAVILRAVTGRKQALLKGPRSASKRNFSNGTIPVRSSLFRLFKAFHCKHFLALIDLDQQRHWLSAKQVEPNIRSCPVRADAYPNRAGKIRKASHQIADLSVLAGS